MKQVTESNNKICDDQRDWVEADDVDRSKLGVGNSAKNGSLNFSGEIGHSHLEIWLGRSQKNVALFENDSHLEKWLTVRKMCHSQKNRHTQTNGQDHSKKCVTVGKMGQTCTQMGHTYRKMDHNQKYG